MDLDITYSVSGYEIRAYRDRFLMTLYGSSSNNVAAYLIFTDYVPLPADQLVQLDPESPIVITAYRPLSFLGAYIDILRKEKQPIFIRAIRSGQDHPIVSLEKTQ